ncbi:MAG: hypothetical protein HYV03_07680 [Deltaproteobacteria bacterium]|nr:hypothetical protein [Deltaproteobacteria bacterium]
MALTLLLIVLVGCAKPLVRASAESMAPVARTFAADPTPVYYALRWALTRRGYPVATEDLQSGLLTTTWVPTTVDSHYVQPFQAPDYGVTPSLHQLGVRIRPEGAGRTTVEITSQCKSVAAFTQSSGREERAVLDEAGHYLRSMEVDVTNLGVAD